MQQLPVLPSPLPPSEETTAPTDAPGGCGGKCGAACKKRKMAAAADDSQAHRSDDHVCSGSSEALLDAPEHVLSTLEQDGTRRWIKPKLSMGIWWQRRRILAYVLMVIFIAVPHLRIGGRPLLQLDILAREFTILGHTFLPTDTLLLALLMLSAFVGIVFLTTVMGRAWCGWACPQTVYIEFLFRPIDRLFEGTIGKGGTAKKPMSGVAQIARFITYLILTSVLAHTFLAYFVGTENLAEWLFGSPAEHPVAFAVMAVTTGLLTYDFYYFREQTCMIACPYGRFQSVMLDEQSLIVAYDENRGEPRAKGRRQPGDTSGDCIDCNRCQVVCPTGIDIRNGLQMECINCTQCIDACDAVMAKVGKEAGLIRYTSQAALKRKPWKLLRARTLIYPLILLALGSGFLLAASTKYSFDARVFRGKGAPFTVLQPGTVNNTFNLRLVNRSREAQTYQLEVIEPSEVRVEVIQPERLRLEEGENVVLPFQAMFPSYLTQGTGNRTLLIQVSDSSGSERRVDFKILGPR
ncbi:MAG: cytochrome c oxidase accessory protein CcoG [Planctomycetota bacterium]